MPGGIVTAMDDMDRWLADAREIGHVRDLGQETPEKAIPELQRLLSLATPDRVLDQVLHTTGRFGAQAAAMLAKVQKIADGHPEPSKRRLARIVTKQIQEAAEATDQP